jgi:hypothetical protein
MRPDKKADETESDVQRDDAVAGSRAPEGEYVGRVAGDTSGETGESGAEKRQRAAEKGEDRAG